MKQHINLFVLFLSVFVFLSGCASKAPPSGSVKGHLSWKGKSLGNGTVTLYDQTRGNGASSEVDASGSFAINKIETGTYAVSITPTVTDPAAPPTSKDFPLPTKYADGATSGLTVQVNEGENILNLDLN